MNKATLMLGTCFAAILGLAALGCAGSANNQATPFNAATGQHPDGWIQNHWEAFIQNPSQCSTCHGSTSDPAASGGIAKVSCFTCHANGPWHPQNWADPTQHGRNGAELAPNPNDPTAMAGFAHCARCHGSMYNNPIGVTVSCLSCHTKAPHPDKTVWAAVPPTVDQPNHYFTDPGNAPECFKCHEAGNNSDLKPAAPPAAGAQPGCFNNTMCHGGNFTAAASPGAHILPGTH